MERCKRLLRDLNHQSAPMSPSQARHTSRQLPPPQQRPLPPFEPVSLGANGPTLSAVSPIQPQYPYASTNTPAAFSSPDDFQHAFRDLQAAVFHDDFSAPNEVMLGFGQDWFEQDSPSFVGPDLGTNNYSNDFITNRNGPRMGLGGYDYPVSDV